MPPEQDLRIQSLYIKAHRVRAQARIIKHSTWTSSDGTANMLLQMMKSLAGLLEELADGLAEASRS